MGGSRGATGRDDRLWRVVLAVGGCLALAGLVAGINWAVSAFQNIGRPEPMELPSGPIGGVTSRIERAGIEP